MNPAVGFQPLAVVKKCSVDLLEVLGCYVVPVVGLEPTRGLILARF